MKPGRDSIKKSDSDSVTEPGSENQGVDFLQVLLAGGGIIGALALIFLILRYLLHVI
jgi:hypothetical protein